MCMEATCQTCSKTTWTGCGLHIPRVMDTVSESDRCTCEPKTEFQGKKYPPGITRPPRGVIPKELSTCEQGGRLDVERAEMGRRGMLEKTAEIKREEGYRRLCLGLLQAVD